MTYLQTLEVAAVEAAVAAVAAQRTWEAADAAAQRTLKAWKAGEAWVAAYRAADRAEFVRMIAEPTQEDCVREALRQRDAHCRALAE